jgi:hypothetical protein
LAIFAGGAPADAGRRGAANRRRWWDNSAMALTMALPSDLLTRLGVPRRPDLNHRLRRLLQAVSELCPFPLSPKTVLFGR